MGKCGPLRHAVPAVVSRDNMSTQLPCSDTLNYDVNVVCRAVNSSNDSDMCTIKAFVKQMVTFR